MSGDKEFYELKTGLSLLESRMSDMSKALTKNLETQTSTSENINKLLVKMAERDIRDEYNEDKRKKFSEFMEASAPIINRAKRGQDRVDNFVSGVTSGYGKLFITILSGALLLSLAVALGIDVKLLRG